MSEKLIFEESKFQELFTFQFKYNFDSLQLILKAVVDRLNSQQEVISKLDKTVTHHSELVFKDHQHQGLGDRVQDLEYLGRMHSQQILDHKSDHREFKETTQNELKKHSNSLSDLQQQLYDLRQSNDKRLALMEKSATYAVKTAKDLKNKFEQLKEATAPDLELSDTEALDVQDNKDVVLEAVDKMAETIAQVQRDFLRKLNEEEDQRMKASQRLERRLNKTKNLFKNINLTNFKTGEGNLVDGQRNEDGQKQTKDKSEAKDKVKPSSAAQQRKNRDLDDQESSEEIVNQRQVDPMSKEFKTQDNYFKLTPEQVFTYTKKEIQKIRTQMQDERDEVYKHFAENTVKFTDLRKLIADVQTNYVHSLEELETTWKNNLEEQLKTKADLDQVEKITPVLTNFEDRIKDIESLKLMVDLNTAAQDERITTLRYKMDAFEMKMGVVVNKLSSLSNGQIDKTLQMSTDDLANQKKQIEENAAASQGQTSTAGMRELSDKVQRIYHQLEELKKSYFKKIKEIDHQIANKASKEQLSATEKKLVDILELTFAQLGEKFASKPQTSEQLFKLKSQVIQLLVLSNPLLLQLKSIFELLISTGVISLDEENQDDQAMFLKKPLGGFSCASCDSKLKNVSNQSGMFNQWKKLPTRDPMDRLPRAGQGFSKILQNIKNPRDLEWEEGPQLQLINPPQPLQKVTKLSKSHILIPQSIQSNDQQQQYLDVSSLPKLTTPRKIE